jgi:hypothetical protein
MKDENGLATGLFKFILDLSSISLFLRILYAGDEDCDQFFDFCLQIRQPWRSDNLGF